VTVTDRHVVELNLPQVRPRSVSDEVAARLERLIVAGDLKPGDRLPSERDLAATLNVSRASLRQAMHELEAKRLIERRPGRGTTVLPAPDHVTRLYAKVTGKEREVREASELRATIEPALARLAALRATEGNLIALDAILADSAGDLASSESLRLDLEFHLLVAQAAGNALMAELATLAASWTKQTRAFSHASPQGRQASYQGHRRILAAIRASEPEAAQAAMTGHLAEVDELIRAGLRLPGPSS
jgi:DNA-binding FadR family transcriptional regulator